MGQLFEVGFSLLWVIQAIQSHENSYFDISSPSFAAIASPTCLVDDFPPISGVRIPASMTILTASSTSLASEGRTREYRRSMAMERIAATGLTMPFPAISGADPTNL
jgi:hypothetical protein